jgi:hypothetical protein
MTQAFEKGVLVVETGEYPAYCSEDTPFAGILRVTDARSLDIAIKVVRQAATILSDCILQSEEFGR